VRKVFAVRADEEHCCRVTVSDEPWKGDIEVEDSADITADLIMRTARHKCGLPCEIAETDRLLIRELTEEDLPSLKKLVRNENERKLLGPAERNLTDGEFLRAYIKSQYGFFGYGIWGIVLKENNGLIGKAGLTAAETDGTGSDMLELSYHIGEPFRRRGYAFEACTAILEFAYREFGTERFLIRVRKDNPASLSLALKLKTSRPQAGGRFQVCISIPQGELGEVI
jgi:RimJ/RimL family protein N-acetyltransferase